MSKKLKYLKNEARESKFRVQFSFNRHDPGGKYRKGLLVSVYKRRLITGRSYDLGVNMLLKGLVTEGVTMPGMLIMPA